MTNQEIILKCLITHPMKKFYGANAVSVAAGLASSLQEARDHIGGTPLLNLVRAGRVQRRRNGREYIFWYDSTKDLLATKTKLSLEERIRRLEIKVGI